MRLVGEYRVCDGGVARRRRRESGQRYIDRAAPRDEVGRRGGHAPRGRRVRLHRHGERAEISGRAVAVGRGERDGELTRHDGGGRGGDLAAAGYDVVVGVSLAGRRVAHSRGEAAVRPGGREYVGQRSVAAGRGGQVEGVVLVALDVRLGRDGGGERWVQVRLGGDHHRVRRGLAVAVARDDGVGAGVLRGEGRGGVERAAMRVHRGRRREGQRVAERGGRGDGVGYRRVAGGLGNLVFVARRVRPADGERLAARQVRPERRRALVLNRDREREIRVVPVEVRRAQRERRHFVGGHLRRRCGARERPRSGVERKPRGERFDDGVGQARQDDERARVEEVVRVRVRVAARCAGRRGKQRGERYADPGRPLREVLVGHGGFAPSGRQVGLDDEREINAIRVASPHVGVRVLHAVSGSVRRIGLDGADRSDDAAVPRALLESKTRGQVGDGVDQRAVAAAVGGFQVNRRDHVAADARRITEREGLGEPGVPVPLPADGERVVGVVIGVVGLGGADRVRGRAHAEASAERSGDLAPGQRKAGGQRRSLNRVGERRVAAGGLRNLGLVGVDEAKPEHVGSAARVVRRRVRRLRVRLDGVVERERVRVGVRVVHGDGDGSRAGGCRRSGDLARGRVERHPVRQAGCVGAVAERALPAAVS